MSASLVAFLCGAHRRVEEVALSRDAAERAVVLGAIRKAILVLAALRAARLHLLPSGFRGQVRIEDAVDQLLEIAGSNF